MPDIAAARTRLSLRRKTAFLCAHSAITARCQTRNGIADSRTIVSAFT
jgi:hypothetical protein